MKKCSICGKQKEEIEFHKCKRNPDGYDYRCKTCCHNYWIEKRKNPIIKRKLNQKKKEWDIKNHEYKIQKGKDYYYSHIKKFKDNYKKREFLGKLNGTSTIGSHIKRDMFGNLDFIKEQSIVEGEKREIFSKGNGNRKITFEQIRWWSKIEYISNENMFILNRFYLESKCNFCNEGVIVIPNKIKNSDYDKDGFVMPFCCNCGVVKEF